MKKSFWQILVLALALTFIFGAAFANVTTVNVTINQIPLEDTGEKGRVVWEQSDNSVIEAMGIGIVPPYAVNATQGMALAKRGATMDAQRNLLEQIQGVQVSAESTMVNFMVNDVVKTRVQGMVKGAKIVREFSKPDGSYIVIMQMNMYGPDSLAAVVFNSGKPTPVQPFPQPAPSYRPAFSEGYTGLIIVAKNMGLQSTFSPRVYDESGNIIYGNKYIDPDFAINNGMVDYYRSLDAVRGNSRAGANPLVINATRVTDHNFNVVISNEDAQKVLAAHAQSGFMKKCAVVFVRN